MLCMLGVVRPPVFQLLKMLCQQIIQKQRQLTELEHGSVKCSFVKMVASHTVTFHQYMSKTSTYITVMTVMRKHKHRYLLGD